MADGVAPSPGEIAIRLRVLQVEEFVRKNWAAKKSIDDVSGSAKKLGETATHVSRGSSSGLGLLAASLSQVKFAAAGLVLTAGAAVAQTARLGLSVSSQLEQTQVGFTNMLKSKAVAKDLVKDLTNFADWSPYGVDDVNKWAQSLIGIGAKKDQIIPTLTAVGDAVSAMGGSPEQVNGAVVAIEQIAAKAKLSAQELNQLAENRIFARDILAKGLGVSTGELMQFLDKGGTVGSATAIPILLRGLEEQYKGSLLAQSKTASGLWSTFKDKLKGVIRADPDSPFMFALRKWLTGLIEDMPAIQRVLRTWFVNLWDFGGSVAEIGKRIKNTVAGAIGAVTGAGGSFATGQTIGVAFPNLLTSIFDQFDKWSSGADWFDIGKTVGGKAIGFTFGFLTGIFDLKAWGSFLQKHWWDALLVVVSLFPIGKVGGAIGKVLSKVPLLGKLGEVFTKGGGFLERVGGPVWKMIQGIGRALFKGFERVFPGAGAVLRRVGRRLLLGFTVDIPNLLRGARDGFGPAIERLLTKGFEWAFKSLRRFGTWLRENFVAFIFGGIGVAGPGAGLFVAFWDQIKDSARGFFDWLGRGFTGVVNGFIDALNGVLSVQMYGLTIGPQIGHVNGAARGGTTTSAGLLEVGEAGREILALPSGSAVYPKHRASEAAAATGGMPGEIHSHLYIDGREVAVAVNKLNNRAVARR